MNISTLAVFALGAAVTSCTHQVKPTEEDGEAHMAQSATTVKFVITDNYQLSNGTLAVHSRHKNQAVSFFVSVTKSRHEVIDGTIYIRCRTPTFNVPMDIGTSIYAANSNYLGGDSSEEEHFAQAGLITDLGACFDFTSKNSAVYAELVTGLGVSYVSNSYPLIKAFKD